ncbi:MAG: hypothetical protein M0Z73_13335 [Betaproteobacteria bacterium]|nr:hypothetical protein [Betaproteobacteria bacterium]
MQPDNKKPDAHCQPSKGKSRPQRTGISATQRDTHHRIEAQSAHSQNPPRPWYPEEYPDLYRLIESARATAQARRRLRGRIVFHHEGRSYAARFTNLDRIIIEDRQTGRFIASSDFFAL